MASISAISTYNNAMLQWQNQQLTGNSSQASRSGATSSLASLTDRSTSMTSQIASLVELTKYAMERMGVGENGRVTFGQISKYREQLAAEFNQGVKSGLSAYGVSDLSGLVFTLSGNGNIQVSSQNAADQLQAQAWFDANKSVGSEMADRLATAGFGEDSSLKFSLDSKGGLHAISAVAQSVSGQLFPDEGLVNHLTTALASLGVTLEDGLSFNLDSAGNLTVSGRLEQSDQVNQWLRNNPALARAVKSQLESLGVDVSSVSLRLDSQANLSYSGYSGSLGDLQEVLDTTAAGYGVQMKNGLEALGIDPNISFTLQVNDDGSVTVASASSDRDKLQKFFDANPELVTTYRQIEVLSGVDDARSALKVSPSATRKRIQMESIAAWWFTSGNNGNSSSYFGNYASGGLSMMSGLNVSV